VTTQKAKAKARKLRTQGVTWIVCLFKKKKRGLFEMGLHCHHRSENVFG